ncbi:hypothetical protein ACHAWO_010051 [Cyclotella atomus]|uniref:Uncharacterized protein n=1 Tax=Cyclotella atomus TaxID=382360 RepID=A0ABD3P2U0_9STRA
MPNFGDLNQTIPEQSVIDKFLSNWNYYSKISYENSDMSSRVRNFTSDPPPPISESNIPHRLVFTHFADLFDCIRSAANSSSPLLYNLAENAKHTVNLYAEIWYDVEYVFLTDDDCVTVVNESMPELVRWFENPMLEGMYKADICRAAYLYLRGGYYFDIDVLVVRPYVAPANTNFVTVRGDGWPENGFFQAFLAAEKGHPIIHKSLQLMLDYMNSNKKHYLGPMALMESWVQIANITNATTAQSKDGVHLLAEANLMELAKLLPYPKIMAYLESNFTTMLQQVPVQFGDRCQFSAGACNVMVMDELDETVYFYSRVIGTTWCGKKIRSNCTTAGMLAERLKMAKGG